MPDIPLPFASTTFPFGNQAFGNGEDGQRTDIPFEGDMVYQYPAGLIILVDYLYPLLPGGRRQWLKLRLRLRTGLRRHVGYWDRLAR